MIGTGDFSGLEVDEMGFLCIRTLASEHDGNLAAALQLRRYADFGETSACISRPHYA
jgi:hypothetical protein